MADLKQKYQDKNGKALKSEPKDAKVLKSFYELDDKGSKVAYVRKYDVEQKGE